MSRKEELTSLLLRSTENTSMTKAATPTLISGKSPMSWEAYKAINPLPGEYDKGMVGTSIPTELGGLFTDEELGITNRESLNLKGVPDSLRGIFSDKELGLTDDSNVLKEKGQEEKLLHGELELKVGDKDEDPRGLVRRIQELLAGKGFRLRINGEFDPSTRKAVIEFQGNNADAGLQETGVVNDETYIALKRPSSKGKGSLVRRRKKSITSSGSGRVSASKLYADLISGINSPNLCKAMVANAIAESGLRYNANGDCGGYAKSREGRAIDTAQYGSSFAKPSKGLCCSFGLWQYNICGGLGVRLLGAYQVTEGSSDEAKIAILTSYDKQVEFMIKHVNGKIEKLNPNMSVDEWVDWFVRKVERPANMDAAVVKRQQIARGLSFG